ncbi:MULTISPECIES: hypothetical protein [unclassified Microcoleus]|uniref:hypothetical protein n=1 Tax=unclassified Microcoleus TaxID=2642155 RepID=UPI002FD68144
MDSQPAPYLRSLGVSTSDYSGSCRDVPGTEEGTLAPGIWVFYFFLCGYLVYFAIARGQKPGFCREDALQLAETAKNPVSWVLIRKP